jgi:uncharacterized protein (TIGR02145 family)
MRLLFIFVLFNFNSAFSQYSGSSSTDQDGNSFLWENYGTLDWAIENVKVSQYSDGTTIPQVTDAAQWSTLTTGAWCYFENDPNNGKLYNWYAMSGNIAPDGWRVATDEDWNNLENYLIQNGFNFDGSESGNNIAKSMSSISEWITSTVEGSPGKDPESNNISGFNASPEGIRQSGGGFHPNSKGYFTIFGSSTEVDNQYFKRRSIGNENPSLVDGQSGKKGGYSLRFVRDANTSPTYAPNDGMLAYYNFNGNADDLSGNGYDGVINGATLVVGVDENDNSAYSFDGEDDSIHLENLPINLDPSNSYTFMFHVKTPLSVSQTGGAIISNYQNHSSQSELFIGVYNDVIRVWGDGSQPIQSCNNSSQDWRNVIVTIQGSTSKVYVDSQLICTDTILISSGASSHSTFIGKTDCPTTSNQCNYFSGLIDELGVWNRVLSENEISNLSYSISTLSVNKNQRTIEEGVIIFPNPTSTIINIDFEFSIAKVFDLTGRKVLESNFKTIDLSELPNSIYLLRLYDNSKNVLGTSKVIKK